MNKIKELKLHFIGTMLFVILMGSTFSGCKNNRINEIRFLIDNESKVPITFDIKIFIDDELVCSDSVPWDSIADNFKLCHFSTEKSMVKLRIESTMLKETLNSSLMVNSDTTYLITYKNPAPEDTILSHVEGLKCWPIPHR